MNRHSNRTLLLLLDKACAPCNSVRAWLTDNGVVAWAANDVSHAIEELSDYTVMTRPDVVVLEVQSLQSSYDTLCTAFGPVGGDGDVRVVALSDKIQRHRDPFFADDLADLKMLISNEIGRPEMALN